MREFVALPVKGAADPLMAADKLHADDTPALVLGTGTGKIKTDRLWSSCGLSARRTALRPPGAAQTAATSSSKLGTPLITLSRKIGVSWRHD
jgi:hypothetical protein